MQSKLSLEINVLNRFAESSHQSGNPECIHGAFLIYIIVVPGFIESKFHEFRKLISLQTEMFRNNLVSNDFGLILKDEEFFVWFSFCSDTFSSVFLNNVSSECVNWGRLRLIIVSWELSGVSIFPFSTIVVVSDEATELGIESSKVSASFFNSSKSDVRLSLEVLVTIRAIA